MKNRQGHALNRRTFASSMIGVPGALALARTGVAAESDQASGMPFGKDLEFKRRPMVFKAEPFAPGDVKVRDGVFAASAAANQRYLMELDADRLLHNFRVNAGVASSAEPLGGWEKPDCELRGHFVGHFLSACAFSLANPGENELKRKATYIVAELAKCQGQLAKTSPGYLSAFPISYFDRLDARTKVWAPFYTIHKIMAGLYDMGTLAGNEQALSMVKGMARWADDWTAGKSEGHMQSILETEYGGMNDIFYQLAGLTGDDHYIAVGDRFTKKRFFNPLALRRDELQGLHANTHIPQVIGAARRYELTGDNRFRDVAEFFTSEIYSARSYATGGTSNNEGWLVAPGKLSEELPRSAATTEDCCAYNMLKLTRHLYRWSADARFFDYYERTMLNHRLPAIDRKTGATQYYLSVFPGAWKTFNKPNDSFWCCTGTGVEEFSKLNDSIYFHDGEMGVFVNLFIASELRWAKRNFVLRQETAFPESDTTQLTVQESPAEAMAIHLRIPYWAGNTASVQVNGEAVGVVPSAGSYYTLSRRWKKGDRITLRMPMQLRLETLPDDRTIAALLYGPLVLAGKLGGSPLTAEETVGPLGPALRGPDFKLPELRVAAANLQETVKPIDGAPMTFRAAGENGAVTLAPFYKTFDTRYSVYWRVA